MSEQAGEMVPPWERYPTYERYTIGWRMGDGEQYLYDWTDVINSLPKDYESRLAYLKRHRPAPLTWGDSVLWVLFPDADSDQDYGCSEAETKQLLELGLIEHDAAYRTWLAQQSGVQWPWQLPVNETPEESVRYCTREFWFFSRQFNANRQTVAPKPVPYGWEDIESELLTGRLGYVDSSLGLLTLAQMFCAGSVQAPWTLGLSPSQFTGSFEMDMGYCDAYQLWLMCAFDDDALLNEMLESTGVPNDWADWLKERSHFG